ncbi:hypothetical protein N7452_004562 [Penicillium brevicompactum]|uniref:Xylanolytic transcriptional activator regulatory domain-containing protein n=1 Tax=Penicillium brevicompactum TaxID=5074 RepID=A0A9W9UEV5_PENBR|nr:hypothetical protein N7452_004562 [Penicillium brevicompactum]
MTKIHKITSNLLLQENARPMWLLALARKPTRAMLPVDQGRCVWANPFTLPSRTVNGLYKGKSGWIWLAPTSLWSLTTRLSLMLAENLHPEIPYRFPSSLNKEIYPMRWRPAPIEDPPDISGLPSADDALYQFNTVKHHLDQHYRFFDEESFTRHLDEFYAGNSLQKATGNRLWFVHFLLVLAFGNAFLLRSRSTKDPPGSRFFLRALSLLPDYANLWTDGLLAVEVLALAGLYLYCIDHRESAHVYIGQAIRIAQLDGLHTELPEHELGVETVSRCRNLWWTLYVMDRHVSSSLGLPMTTQDSDITTTLNPAPAGSRPDATLSLHVKLSYLFSSILTCKMSLFYAYGVIIDTLFSQAIYKNEKTELGIFLEKTRTILQTMTIYAREIENMVHPKSTTSVETMPKGTRYITLLYHQLPQCVLVATRPLLLSVLKERLERLGDIGHREDDWRSFLAPTKALISTGIKSAIQTLQILTDEDSLLGKNLLIQRSEGQILIPDQFAEVFLPFEMEVTYGAALHLIMATTLFPHSTAGYEYSEQAHSIFDEMIFKGNKLATARKTELSHLEELFRDLAMRIESHGLQTLTLTTPEHLQSSENPISPLPVHVEHSGESLKYQGTDARAREDTGYLPSSPHISNNVELLDGMGISSYEFLSIIEQIGGAESSILDPGPSWEHAL